MVASYTGISVDEWHSMGRGKFNNTLPFTVGNIVEKTKTYKNGRISYLSFLKGIYLYVEITYSIILLFSCMVEFTGIFNNIHITLWNKTKWVKLKHFISHIFVYFHWYGIWILMTQFPLQSIGSVSYLPGDLTMLMINIRAINFCWRVVSLNVTVKRHPWLNSYIFRFWILLKLFQNVTELCHFNNDD